MKMTKEVVRRIGEDMKIAMESVAKKYGLSLKVHGGSYSETTFTKKFEVFVPEVDLSAKISKKDVLAWEVFAPINGLKKEFLGMTFKDGNEMLKVVGWNTRCHKNPVKLENVKTGKSYKCDVSFVKRFLN